MEILGFILIAVVVIAVLLFVPLRRKSQQPKAGQTNVKHEHRAGRARAMRDRLRSKTPPSD